MTHRRIAFLLAAAVALVVVSWSAAPAFAARSNAQPFPSIPDAPNWYASTPPAPYSTTGIAASSNSEEDSTTWDEEVLYYLPAGGPPPSPGDGAQQPDIQVSNFAEENLMTVTAPLDPQTAIFDLVDPFPVMAQQLGTTMTTGIVIPPDANSAQANAVEPTVKFLGHGYVEVERPAIPSSCSAQDPDQYAFDAAMLGANGDKYLVSFNVSFGDRSQERSQICAGQGKTATGSGSALSTGSSALSRADKSAHQKVSDAKRTAKARVRHVKAKAKSKFQTVKEHLTSKKSAPIIASVLGVLAILGIITGYVIWQVGKTRGRSNSESRKKRGHDMKELPNNGAGKSGW